MKNKLFQKDFTLVVLGQIVSLFGAAILRFALNLYVLDITGRVDIFALVLAMSVVPGIIFTPIGGAIADRINRRDLMVIFDFSSSGVVLLLLLLLSAGKATVTVITIIMAALFTISSLYQPAVQASVPVLVPEEHLASANGIVSSINALASLIAPILGGILYGIAGLYALVIISCAAFFLSAVMEIFIHIPFVKQKRSQAVIPTILGDMKTGMTYILKENPKIFKTILLAAAFNMLVSPLLIVGIPFILRITLQSSETMYGIGLGIGQLSMILGAMLVGIFSKKLNFTNLYRVFFIIAALIIPMAAAMLPQILNSGYWPPFTLFTAFSSIALLLSTVISIVFITIVQKETPNEMLGKVMAIIMTIAQCAAPAGQAIYGFAFEQFKTAIYIPILLAAFFSALVAFCTKIMLRNAEQVPEEIFSGS